MKNQILCTSCNQMYDNRVPYCPYCPKPEGGMRIDCKACGLDDGMQKTKVPRFTGPVRFIGYIILLPSGFAVAITLIGLFSTLYAAFQTDSAGVAVAGVGISGFLVVCAFVGSLLGWLLVMEKKVWWCTNCGHTLDRA